MRINNKYSVESSPQIIALLDQLEVAYKRLNCFNTQILQFYLYDNDERKKEIDTNLIGWNLIIPELNFSKAEYENATWYRFMPKYDKIPLCESELTYSYFCKDVDGTVDYDSTHKHQIGNYRLNKTPKWPNDKCILSAEGNHDHMWFTNDKTRSFLDSVDINGLRFDPVIGDCNGRPLANTYQIVFEYTVPEEAIVHGNEYGISSIVPCPNCGEKRYYVCPQTYQLCLYQKYLGDKDVYVTQAVFGQGYGYRIVIGSKKFYKLLKENGFGKYFRIHPIKVIHQDHC